MSSLKEGDRIESNNCGFVEVVHYQNAKNVFIQFDDTGFVKAFDARHIRESNVRDPYKASTFGVGYMGEGKHKSRVNRVRTKSYQAWTKMLERCYSQDWAAKYPTYDGCTVCDKWLNFQSFADWFDVNYIEGYHLDKDILAPSRRGKLYSPSRCMYVSPSENIVAALAGYFTMVSPSSETTNIYNMSEFCRINGLCASKMIAVNKGRRGHHNGWTRHGI